MALTPEQEARLLQIIIAFDGGKRLNELPQANSKNPFDLICEVLDKDGESKQAKLAEFLPYIEEQCAYGIELDTTISTPDCKRIGNSDLHRTLPIQSRMKGCLLDDNGNVTEYLNPNNWKAHDRSGARGQVMVEIPDHYRNFVTEGTKRRAYISEYPLPGYHFVPKSYVSAYEATVERSTSKLCSVVNLDVNYRGCGNQADWDGTYRTALGRPATGISRTSFRSYARKRNAETSQWNCSVYEQYKTIAWLFYIEYATLNSQAAFNAEKDGNGYAQGGLGNGVTTLSSGQWNRYNSSYPFAPCGHTDELGNRSGEVAYAIPASDETVLATVYTNRYRGIENPFGHIWKWTDGINIRISPTTENGGDDLSKLYVCDDPSKFNDTNYEGYKHAGNLARSEGYIKSVIFGEEGDIAPEAVGGGSTTYFCDYYYTNIPTIETLRGVLFGGSASYGAPAGLACAYSNNAPSATPAGIGSRLCFIP